MLYVPTLTIIRGVPGSGKTTVARKLADEQNALHYEADMFFETSSGYKFDPSKLKDAHEWCQERVASALLYRRSVIVSNTFTRLWEMQPYINMSTYPLSAVRVLRCTGRFQNVHGVPDEKVTEMLKRFEDLPAETFVHPEAPHVA